MNTKDLRNKLGLSQTKFAKKLGLHLNTVRGWEYGRKPSPMAQEKIDRLIKEGEIIER